MNLSLITVCYNCADALSRTLQSVLEQSEAPAEYIIIDGGSRDGTPELLQAYEPLFGNRLRRISEQDQGIYDAMNKGLALAAGEIVGFLNADDVFRHQDVLATIRRSFMEHPETDAVHANLEFINQSGHVVRKWCGCDYFKGAFRRGWMPAHPTFYCRKRCFEQYGGFDCAAGSAADFELMLRFIEKHRIRTKFIPESLILMRIGGLSTSGLSAVLRNGMLNVRAFRKNGIPCPWHYPLSRFLSKFSLFSAFNHENH